MSDERAPFSRRVLLRVGGTAAAVVACVSTAAAWTLSLVPKVLYEPSPRRKLGLPSTFPEGKTFLAEHRIFILRHRQNYKALSAECTHLGCTVGTSKDGYHCPCHGSKFSKEGTNLAGPAPRPLPWRPLSLAGDGSLIVDLGGEVSSETVLAVPTISRKKAKKTKREKRAG